jgi:hypothetical protein
MRRLLRPDGLLVATFQGAAMAHVLDRLGWHEPWDEDQAGMHVLGLGTPWDDGGPSVMHSKWWLEAHWGRAFEIMSLATPAEGGHGIFVGRNTSAPVTREDLEAPEPGEPRELAAARYTLRQTQAELVANRAGGAHLQQRVEDLEAELAAQKAEADRLRTALAIVERSRSWRLTAPLRRAAESRRSRR